jgi:hypothetical protein
MGMLSSNSPFRKHFDNAYSYLKDHEGFFVEKYDKRSFINWSGYSGLALEDSWKDNSKRVNDLTFRIYLIKALIDNN